MRWTSFEKNSSILSRKIKIVIFIIASVKQIGFSWGFYAHKQINSQAVYSLPESSLLIFFKNNCAYITKNAVKADQRRYIIKEEAARHYIDLDVYKKDTSLKTLPKYFSEAVKVFNSDSLEKHGILPWHIFRTYNMLVAAMKEKNAGKILKLASDIGHYVGDANVPLHTTHNYDGQLTNQKGIHSLWESRVPELFSKDYDMLVGKADYIKDVQQAAWNMVYDSNRAVDSVLQLESAISTQIADDKKYSFEERNNQVIRTYSSHFSEQYSLALNGQVERQIQKAIRSLASIWYTAWIDAGQPDLSSFNTVIISEEPEEEKINIKNDRFLESHNCTHDHSDNYTLLTKK